MNPNAQLTIRDRAGRMARVRYKCLLESSGGLKVEALVRFQVGWIAPRVTYAELPNVILLGRGFDVSLPLLFHFTMVDVLDEAGCATGSTLYFSGTPMLGLSAGYARIAGGRLVLNPERGKEAVDPALEGRGFVGGNVHVRQLGFLAMKLTGWVLATVLCMPFIDGIGWVRYGVHACLPPAAASCFDGLAAHVFTPPTLCGCSTVVPTIEASSAAEGSNTERAVDDTAARR